MSGITPWVRAGGGCLGLAVLLLLFQSYFLSVGVSPRIGFKESEELLEKQAKQHHRTVRERFLNVTLPIQVDPKITAILDEAFFVKTCDSETRGIAFIPTRNGLGAHFIMMGYSLSLSLYTHLNIPTLARIRPICLLKKGRGKSCTSDKSNVV